MRRNGQIGLGAWVTAFFGLVAAMGLASPHAAAAPIAIANHSFEADPNNANEFFFGTPTGWQLVDPGGIIANDNPAISGVDVTGSLTVTGGAYFGGVAPDGDNVGIIFLGEEIGTSEVGLAQVLGAALTANTTYTLTVAVDNIESGPTQQFGNFDLSGFPGYRIELLAGNTLLASNSEGIASPIAEGVFEDRSLVFTPDASHAALLGQALQIRLYNTNLTDPAFPGVDLEVDFDNVRLDATTTPVDGPAGLPLLAFGLAVVGLTAGRRRA